MHIKYLILFILTVRNVRNENYSKLSHRDFNLFDISEDGNLATDQLITKYGYPAESHYVTTVDGYILCIHRIRKDGGKPFFLQHGLLDSSAGFIIMGTQLSIGYLLWDMGYDVWMGNARGNRYSRNHTRLNPDLDTNFWQFSWHEIGVYDLPAMIDYVLNFTSLEKLYYLGYSQGTTAFWVMCSKRPEYNEKIILMQAFAPVAFMSHIKTPLHKFSGIAQMVIRSLGINELIIGNDNLKKPFCTGKISMANMTIYFLFLLVGRNPKEFNQTMLPVICGHYPAGAATNQVRHYLQMVKSGRFCEYDFGPQKNKEKYGSAIPPNYNLSKITAPVILHYSANDYLTDPVDIEKLFKQLHNPFGKYFVPMPEFSHVDFIWAIHVRTLLYDRVLQIIKDFDNGNLTKVVE